MIARKSSWQLQEAKNKLSEVIRRARAEGPQTITVRGEDAVVLVDAKGFEEYGRTSHPRESLYAFMQRWAERMEGIELEIPVRRPEPALREGIIEMLNEQ